MKIELKILDKELYYNATPYKCLRDENSRHAADWVNLPAYQTPGSAAMDLISAENVVLYPGECKLIKTGIAIWIGSRTYIDSNHVWNDGLGIAAKILPRSGRGHKEGLVLGNGTGLIDEDYKSELLVSAWNRNSANYIANPNWPEIGGYEIERNENEHQDNIIKIFRGERFAQIMFVPVIKAQWNVVEEFSEPNTTHLGFGSTGV